MIDKQEEIQDGLLQLTVDFLNRKHNLHLKLEVTNEGSCELWKSEFMYSSENASDLTIYLLGLGKGLEEDRPETFGGIKS